MEVRAGVYGGTLLVIIAHLHLNEMVSAAILAAIGALVSFSVSHFLKYLFHKVKRKIQKSKS